MVIQDLDVRKLEMMALESVVLTLSYMSALLTVEIQMPLHLQQPASWSPPGTGEKV